MTAIVTQPSQEDGLSFERMNDPRPVKDYHSLQVLPPQPECTAVLPPKKTRVQATDTAGDFVMGADALIEEVSKLINLLCIT